MVKTAMVKAALIDQVAGLVLAGFERYRQSFRTLTLGAKARFEQADWLAVQAASLDRIKLYKLVIKDIRLQLDDALVSTSLDLDDWRAVKNKFSTLIQQHQDFELAETVFNTVYRKSSHFESGEGSLLLDDHVFVTESERVADIASTSTNANADLTISYGPSSDLRDLLTKIFKDHHFSVPYQNLEEDIGLIATTMNSCIPLLRQSSLNPPRELHFEILRSVFYRNKGAYLIGHLTIDEHFFPIAIPIHNGKDGLYVDAIIWNENDLSVIFSFSRAYFMVDIDIPRNMIAYLKRLLPGKKTWELYTAVGFFKHGKTEFYRGFLAHLENSTDQFVIAKGIKGLVMSVFTLPSYNVVFKIIKDKFSPTKKVTRKQVRDAYKLVKTHDRVGRMADTQEFTDFAIPKNRFSEELIAELLKVAAASISITSEYIVISHLYTERLMTPMNLYMQGKSDLELELLLEEYGNAIKQLAAANIFPGDMLLKNFGVTRHGRVIFYDYDEICYLTEINFREIPPPRYPEDALSAEPWYSIAANDVFPEEFINFLFYSAKLRDMFCALHGDLFTVQYWQGLQNNILNHQLMDVLPYRQSRRFLRNR